MAEVCYAVQYPVFASVEFKQGEAVAPSGAAAFSHACTLCRRHGVPPENGGARPPSAMPLLADAPTRLKRYARLPCRCAAAALSGLRRCGGSAGARPLRRGRGSAPAEGLRGRLVGRCAPARRPLGGRPAPPRFGALRRGGCRCGGKRESRPCGRLSGKAEN